MEAMTTKIICFCLAYITLAIIAGVFLTWWLTILLLGFPACYLLIWLFEDDLGFIRLNKFNRSRTLFSRYHEEIDTIVKLPEPTDESQKQAEQIAIKFGMRVDKNRGNIKCLSDFSINYIAYLLGHLLYNCSYNNQVYVDIVKSMSKMRGIERAIVLKIGVARINAPAAAKLEKIIEDKIKNRPERQDILSSAEASAELLLKDLN